MKHVLENDEWSVEINEKGAELSSVQKKAEGREYIWQGDPDVWAGQAPILFPIVGRLKDDQYRIEGQTYTMKRHGFARERDFNVLEQTRKHLKFGLTADQETMQQYPYNFVLDVSYRLKENILRVTYEVTNKDQRNMPFSIGAHPAFSTPRIIDKQMQEYHLIFDQTETLDRHFIVEGLRNGDQKPILKNEKKLSLHPKLFKQDALIFKNHQSKTVSLVAQSDGEKLVEMSVAGFPYLGIWQKVGADYICIEPWYGIADTYDFAGELKDKEGIMVLKLDDHFRCSYDIRFY